MKPRSGVLPGLGLALAACAGLPGLLRYPAAPQVPVVDNYFGTPVADPYRWLEEPDSAQTRAWVEAQNRLSAPYLKALPDHAAIRGRLAELWSYDRYGVPRRTPSGALLYTRHDGLRNQPGLYVQDAGSAEPRLLLDPNDWSADGTEALVDWVVSPDGRRLAYAVQSGGTDWVEYRVLDIATGTVLPDRVGRINFNFDASRISWRGGNAGFFYSRFPDAPPAAAGSPAEITHHKLYYHRIGTAQDEDVLVYERPDQPKWFVWGEPTDDGRYLLIYVERTEDSEKEVYVKDLGDAQNPKLDAPLRKLIRGWDARYYLVGNQGPVLYFRTGLGAPRQRIVAIDLRRPQPGRWRTVVPESADVMQQALLLGGEILVSYLHDASARLVRYATTGQALGDIPLPGLGTVGELSGRSDHSGIFFGYSSFARPFTAYRHDLRTGRSEAFHPPRLRFNPEDFLTEQVFYRSKDGTSVPLFLSYKKGLKRNGDTPTLLYGYGGFSISLTPSFSVPNLVWMERGGIYAQASLRGGGEYGEAWHGAGMLERKQNVFDDFIAAAEFLVAGHYTRPQQLAIRGRSNGGLLVGAVLNQRPQLFAAATLGVGVLDMLRYHRFGIAYAWAGDYGTSETADGFRYLHAYSPLHNIRPGSFPAVLVTTADRDDRVHPLHSFKYTAALQAAQTGDKPVLIRIETRSGHGVGTALSKQIEEAADTYAFLEYHTRRSP